MVVDEVRMTPIIEDLLIEAPDLHPTRPYSLLYMSRPADVVIGAQC